MLYFMPCKQHHLEVKDLGVVLSRMYAALRTLKGYFEVRKLPLVGNVKFVTESVLPPLTILLASYFI